MKRTIKKLLAAFLTLAVMLSVGSVGIFADDADASAATKYVATENWGPNADGIFEISTPGDLLAMSANRASYNNYSGKTVVLTADINFNPGWDASSGTEPTNIWPETYYMNGTFDGQGHTISGLCRISAGNASFLVLGGNVVNGGTVIKNLRIENSYFHSTVSGGAGLVSAARGGVRIENVYMDAICEGKTNTGAFITAMNCTAATLTPKIEIENCVFAGSVQGGGYAAAFVATNNRASDNKGLGVYSVTLTDCANYGKVVSSATEKAAAFIGNCANTATLTRCFNGGSVETAFVNMGVSDTENLDKAPVTVTFNDCYYDAAKSAKALTKTAEATTYTVNYDGASATDIKTCAVTELTQKTAFKAGGDYKGWVMNKAGTQAVAATVAPYAEGHEHDYDTVVTAPTCSEKGFTTKTCKICKVVTTVDYVDSVDHVIGEDWIVDVEPTLESAGMRHKECTACGTTVRTEILTKLQAQSDTDTETLADTEDNGDDTASDTDGDSSQGGCGSAIGVSACLVAIAAFGAAYVGKKRR